MIRPPPTATRTSALCPYTTLFRSRLGEGARRERARIGDDEAARLQRADIGLERGRVHRDQHVRLVARRLDVAGPEIDLKGGNAERSEEHTSELQSLMRISYAVFCLKKKKQHPQTLHTK